MAYVRGEPGDDVLLHAAFAQMPRGMVVVDRDGRYVAINEALAQSNNLPLERHIGRTMAEVLPQVWPMLEPLFDRVWAGETVTETWDDFYVAHAGVKRSARAVFVPVRVPAPGGSERIAGAAVVFQDVTEELRVRRRTNRLTVLTQSLAVAQTASGILEAAQHAFGDELHAQAAFMGMLDEATGEVVVAAAGADASGYERVPVTFDVPLTRAITTGSEIVLHDLAEHARRWPEGAEAARRNEVEASVTVPLILEGKVIGALGVIWHDPREVAEDDLWFVRAAGARIAETLERVSATERAFRSAQRAAALLGIAARLNTLLDETQVADLIADSVRDLTGAAEAGLFVRSGHGTLVRLDDSKAVDLERRRKYDEMPEDGATPVPHAVRTGQALWLESASDWGAFPEVTQDVEAMGWPAVAVLPLAVASPTGEFEEPFGALYGHYAGPRRLLENDRQFLGTMAELTTATLQRMRLARQEQSTRAQLEVSETRLAVLAESGALGVVEATETHLVSANRAFLDMLGYHELPERGLDWRLLTPPEWLPADDQALAELAERGACRPYEKEYWRADGSRVPVMVSVATVDPDPFRAVATVIDLRERKELERREREALEVRERLSLAVQGALFPRLGLEHSPYQVQVAYRPGDERLALGGDFYDAVTLPDGRLAVVIGDVTGHGPVAAATGAALRAAWRALTLVGHEPHELPALLQDVLVSERDRDTLFATLVMATVSPAGLVELVSAGHPLPLLLDGSGVTGLAAPTHLMLGVSPDYPDATALRLRLQPHQRLLLYTDGVVEGRAHSEQPERLGVARFTRMLQDLGIDVSADEVIDQVDRRHGGGLPDDAAVVIVGPHHR